jgi:hypothetical protein
MSDDRKAAAEARRQKLLDRGESRLAAITANLNAPEQSDFTCKSSTTQRKS